ncbi:RNA polymerase sigma factor [bacterium]|nr:RNA polymerase sigma factor [bacterium]
MARDFEEIMNSCANEVYAYLLARMGNRFDADDVFQSTFLKVRRFLPNFRGEASPTTWVMRIAMNEASSFRRDQGRELSLVTPEDALPDPSTDRMGYDPAQAETVQDITEGMRHLPGDLRDVLYFFYYKALSYEQIATLLGIPKGTVKSRIFRAKQELRVYLEAHRDRRT